MHDVKGAESENLVLLPAKKETSTSNGAER